MIAVTRPSVLDMARIESALAYQDKQTLIDVLRNVYNGSYVLLRASQSTCTVVPREGYLAICQMGGAMEDVGDIIRSCKRIAIDLGLKGVALKGRKGWQRVLKPYGFKLLSDDTLRYTS